MRSFKSKTRNRLWFLKALSLFTVCVIIIGCNKENDIEGVLIFQNNRPVEVQLVLYPYPGKDYGNPIHISLVSSYKSEKITLNMGNYVAYFIENGSNSSNSYEAFQIRQGQTYTINF